MMDRLPCRQVSAKHFLGHQDVLEDIAASVTPGMVDCPDHHVSSFVARLATLPVPIRRPRGITALGARKGVPLLRSTAITSVARPARRTSQVSR
jgi:hypothetical protein